MSSPRPFELARRQPYLTEVAYHNTVKWHADEEPLWNENLERAGEDPERLSSVLGSLAHLAWSDFQMGYTAGLDIGTLSGKLEATVAAYERYADVYDLLPDEKYYAPIMLNSLVDEYVDYLNMFSAAVLLHRHDLIPRIHALNAGTSHDRCDAIIEELLSFFIPGRPMLDEMEWGATYGKLIEAIDAGTPAKRVTRMRHYVRRWYPSMRRACFYGKHEEIRDDYSPYIGYWAFCAGAFSYLYGIDDSSYRDELVYPKDLVDYARSRPREPLVLEDGGIMLRIGGGQPCPREGVWCVPWSEGSLRFFAAGEALPQWTPGAEDPAIWQWMPDIAPDAIDAPASLQALAAIIERENAVPEDEEDGEAEPEAPPTAFELARRQPYITETSYLNTLAAHAELAPHWEKLVAQAGDDPSEAGVALRFAANNQWAEFHLAYTAGAEPEALRARLDEVVAAFERYVGAYARREGGDAIAPLRLDEGIDTYIRYLNLLCAAVLLHRADLVPRIHALNAGSPYDGVDAVIDDLLAFHLPDRENVTGLVWDRPYTILCQALDSKTHKERIRQMRLYVKRWYPSMRKRAAFHDAHAGEAQEAYSDYYGYWAMCAGAFSYLYGIDDKSYREELVYPKDLVDYARSRPREPVVLDDGSHLLRVGGGQPCPRAGLWFVPWIADSDRRFALGEPLPLVSGEGLRGAIWEWDPEA